MNLVKNNKFFILKSLLKNYNKIKYKIEFLHLETKNDKMD